MGGHLQPAAGTEMDLYLGSKAVAVHSNLVYLDVLWTLKEQGHTAACPGA